MLFNWVIPKVKKVYCDSDSTLNKTQCVHWSSLINLVNNIQRKILCFIMRAFWYVLVIQNICMFFISFSCIVYTYWGTLFFLTPSILTILFHFRYPLLKYFESFIPFICFNSRNTNHWSKHSHTLLGEK